MEFIIVTGISGSGKSSAVKVLEDIGFFCIDNMPPQLIPDFAAMCKERNGADEISRLRCMLFMFSSWNFVNETRLTENFATPIICLVTFHFNQLPLLRILTGENQEPSTLASTLA